MRFRAPSRRNPAKQKVSASTTLPAPTKGWWVGENLAMAPPGTALILDDYFPREDYVELRSGSEAHATGMTGDVETLIAYETGTTHELFAANDGAIYDVTAGGAVGAAEISGQTSDRWNWVQFTTTGGTFIKAVNGADTPLEYNGSAWSTGTAITGVTASTLSHVWAFKARLYFVQLNTLKAWYLGTDSIGGAATSIDLSGEFTLGGRLLVGGTWTIDTGQGMVEFCVFITDQGEVAVYNGLYPGDVTTPWQKLGVFRIAKPLGDRCLMKAGGDLVVMTEDGMVPMSKIVKLDKIALAASAVTKPIAPEWRRAVLDRGRASWDICVWPQQSMVLVALPQDGEDERQMFVANAATGAWCRFTGWDVKSIQVMDDDLYFGTSDGRVMQGYTGGQDDGSLYYGRILWNYQSLGSGPALKQAKAAKLLYRTTYNVATEYGVAVDYSTVLPNPPTAIPDGSTQSLWDSAVWDTAMWPGSIEQRGSWQSVTGLGAVLAPYVQSTISSEVDPDVRVQQLDMIYESATTALG